MKLLIATLLLAASAVSAQTPPKGIPVSTWVREDIFAGFMVNDMERFASGMRKVDDILAANPRAADAICWKGGGELYLAARAHETGRAAEFEPLYAKALATFDQCRKAGEGTPYMGAVHAISGGSWAVSADRLPERLRREAWANVRLHYAALQVVQKDSFAKLPPHMKGEVLAGLAQASQRLGDEADFQRRLTDLIDQLPGTVYASRAKRWQENPATAATTSITCQTCHDAGRMEAVLSSRKQ